MDICVKTGRKFCVQLGYARSGQGGAYWGGRAVLSWSWADGWGAPTLWTPLLPAHKVVTRLGPVARVKGGWASGPIVLGRGGGRGCPPALTQRQIPHLWGEDSDAEQLRGNTNRKMNVFYCWIQELLQVLIICVFECAPAVSMHSCARFWRGGDHGFHQSPQSAFDPRGAQ